MSLFEVLDDAADEAVAGRRIDPAAVLERATRPQYRRPLAVVVGHGAPRWRPRPGLPRSPFARGLLVAAAVVGVIVLALAALPAVQRAVPQPAEAPTGPGGIPKLLRTPPWWTPSITERPISRAVYVVSARDPLTPDARAAGLRTPPGLWLVGADGGEYRALPTGGADLPGVALAPDGTRVGWVSGSRYGVASRLDVVDVRTGRQRTLDLAGSGRRGFEAVGLVFSPDGRHLALWGGDVRGPSMRTPQVLVVDATTMIAQPPCTLALPAGTEAASVRETAAWAVRGGTAEVLTQGCTSPANPSAAEVPGAGPATVRITGGLPEPVTPADPLGLGMPTGLPFRPAVVSGSGDARWTVVVAPQGNGILGGVEPVQLDLVRTDRAGAVLDRVDLGAQAGAAVLAATPTGAVVTRWRPDGRFPDGQFGPTDVVLATSAGPEVLSRSDGVQARVSAVAAGVVAGGRSVDARALPPRALDLGWWSVIVQGELNRVRDLPWGVMGQVLLWIGLPLWVSRLLGRAVLRRRRAGVGVGGTPSQVSSDLPVLTRFGPALVAVAVAVGLLVLPDSAPWVPPAPGAATPVLPRTLTDQRLAPPRAFDEIGRPRTTAVGVVFNGTVAGRYGVYATDAATGALVRLDDLPGLGVSVGGWWPTNLAVSPNGRWLSNGGVVVDLQAARWGQIPQVARVVTQANEIARNVAVFDDGSVVIAAESREVWAYPPPTALDSTSGRVPADRPGGTRVAGVTDALGVAVAGPDRVVVRTAPDRPEGADPVPSVLLVDLGPAGSSSSSGSAGSSASPARPVVTPLSTDPNQLVAVIGRRTVTGGPAGVTLRESTARGAAGAGAGPGSGASTGSAVNRRLQVPGGVDAIWLAARSGSLGAGSVGSGAVGSDALVVLGAGATSDLAVSRVPLSGTSSDPVELVRIDPALFPTSVIGPAATTAVIVAAEVVAAARPVDPPAQPWWARLHWS